MKQQRKTVLQDLQDRRDTATTPEAKRSAQEYIDMHFMGTRKKKQKKKKQYEIPEDDWDY